MIDETIDYIATVDLRGDGDLASKATIWSVASTLSIACSGFREKGGFSPGLFRVGSISAGQVNGTFVTMGRSLRWGM